MHPDLQGLPVWAQADVCTQLSTVVAAVAAAEATTDQSTALPGRAGPVQPNPAVWCPDVYSLS